MNPTFVGIVQEASKELDAIEEGIKNVQHHINVASAYMAFPVHEEEDIIDKFLFFAMIQPCIPLVKPCEVTCEKEIESLNCITKDIPPDTAQNALKLTPKAREHQELFERYMSDYQETKLSSFIEQARNHLSNVKNQVFPLQAVVSNLWDLNAIRLLIGICWLHHYKELRLQFDEKKHRWLIHKNGSSKLI